MNANSIRTRTGVAAVALLALGATACGSSSAKSTSATQPQATSAAGSDSGGDTSTTAGGGASTTTPVAAGTRSGHVGDTLSDPDQYVASDVATVTLVKVIDPVTPVDAGTIPDPGSRWVGLDMTIVDNGGNAAVVTDEARVTGSDGKEYFLNADIEGNFKECTSTLHDLQPNQKATFCPGFLLPNGVTITKVGYSTRPVDSIPSEITWTVP